jgi:putative acetyltransferase
VAESRVRQRLKQSNHILSATALKVTIRKEEPKDFRSVRQVNCAAFETEAEAGLVDALRDGGFVELSLVADCDGIIAGHILFSRLPIRLDADGQPGDAAHGTTVAALSLAPMAVRPAFQRQGIGSQLVDAGLTTAREQGHCIVVVLGHPEYYPRFGFSAELAKQLHSPFSGDAWMAIELTPGALDGISGQVEYAPPFGIENETG